MKYITKVDNTHIIEVNGINRKMSQEFSESQRDNWSTKFNLCKVNGGNLVTLATDRLGCKVPYVRWVSDSPTGTPLSDIVLAMEMWKLIQEQTK